MRQLRRMAKRRGLDIRKARTRDPRDIEYERWMIIDPYRSAVIAGTDLDGRPNMTLDEVEAWLLNQVSPHPLKRSPSHGDWID